MTEQYDAPPWLTGFTIPDAPTGAVLAVTFGSSGVWMGRVDGGRRVVSSLSEPRIVPNVLDMRIAAELLENGTVDQTTDPAVFDELTVLAARARDSIGDRDSALVVGAGTLRFLSVTRAEMVEATVPETNRVHGMIVELADSDPVDAVLLGPGSDEWPGLWEALTERGFTTLLPGDPFPETFGGNDAATNVLDRVEAAPVSLAWAAEPSDAGPVSFSASGIDPADYGLDQYGNVQFDSSATDPDAIGEPGDDPDEARRAAESKRRRRITAVAAVAVILALGGVGTAVAMNVHEHDGPSIDQLGDEAGVSSETEAATDTSAPERIPHSADRREVDAARASMLKYTTPPPPPPPKSTSQSDKPRQTEEQPKPGSPPRPKPQRRTIPNPIPGLPPIVVG